MVSSFFILILSIILADFFVLDYSMDLHVIYEIMN